MLALFLVGGGLVGLMVVVTQRSYKQDERSEHWMVYPGAEGGSQHGGASRWAVVLDEPGVRPVLVLKEIRAITGLGLDGAEQLLGVLPSTVVSGVDHATATSAQARLVRAGAQARMAEA